MEVENEKENKGSKYLCFVFNLVAAHLHLLTQ